MSDHGPAPKKPVDYDELFPGRFLKAGLLLDKPITLRIRDVILEALPQDDGHYRVRGIVVFEKTDKQWVLNSTNGQCIKAMFGRTVKDWIGKRVTLGPERDKFGAETVDCVRVLGSPDIAAPITVMIKLPRRRDRPRELLMTGRRVSGSGPGTVTAPDARSSPTTEPPYEPGCEG